MAQEEESWGQEMNNVRRWMRVRVSGSIQGLLLWISSNRMFRLTGQGAKEAEEPRLMPWGQELLVYAFGMECAWCFRVPSPYEALNNIRDR